MSAKTEQGHYTRGRPGKPAGQTVNTLFWSLPCA